MNTPTSLRVGALVAALAAVACSEEAPAPVYQAIPVSRRDIVVSASAAGAVEPVTTVDVKSKASGEVVAVYVETGDQVRPGQPLVRIDQRVPLNALRQAEANIEVATAQLANADAQLKRAEELHKSAAITDQEYEAARLQAAQAKAQLVSAERNLQDSRISYEDTDVRAAISGTIIQRAVEIGTVISSAMSNVGGGTVLMQMANLDTVQVRALVDETDIGKIQPGMDVTITVDAFPNRPFRGIVLKIEPQATVQQNVTMFPVLVRIPNEGALLKPGMNAEVEVHVGNRSQVLAIPNAALRTQRDVSSAATVLGLDPEQVLQQVAEARQRPAGDSGRATLGATTPNATLKPDSAKKAGEKYTTPDGREVTLPAGITAEQVRGLFTRLRSGGFENMSAADRQLMQRLRQSGAMGRPGGGGAGGSGGSFRMVMGAPEQAAGAGGGATSASRGSNDFLFGGNYIVFVMRNGKPEPVPVRTGLTDLDYSEVLSGLGDADTVLILPSASLVQAQEESQQMQDRMRSNAIPGMGGGGGPGPVRVEVRR
jgi:HlyD family secretion protein